MNCAEILEKLESRANPAAVQGMARFGIRARKVYGWPTPALRQLARQIGKNHLLAQQLWASGVHDARVLATLVAEADRLSEPQMERWVKGFDSWAVCDSACFNLFRYTRFAYRKCVEWSTRKEEYVKRAGFALMAGLAISDKDATDDRFLAFLPLIKKQSRDERNFVKKAVNWALRQIGKRNQRLNRAAIKTAREIRDLAAGGARWVASDAFRELESRPVQKRLRA
jgi:3-methyladenine DNA glycosylase AlkD